MNNVEIHKNWLFPLNKGTILESIRSDNVFQTKKILLNQIKVYNNNYLNEDSEVLNKNIFFLEFVEQLIYYSVVKSRKCSIK